MQDPFDGHSTALTSPAASCQDITPDDINDLSMATRAIYVGQTGDIRVEMLDGGVCTLVQAQAGALYPLRVRKVLSTGTTATNLIAFW